MAPPSVPRQTISRSGIAPEITALAESLGSSPARIFRFVHDSIDFDPKWAADSPPLGTLWEESGTSWDQAWLLHELLTAAGIDARLEWGEIEITTQMLENLTGIDDPFRAGDLLTTAGTPIVLVVQGSQVVSARMSHVWVKAHLDYLPNRGVTPGPGDTWVRMDPTLKRFEISGGQRLDEEVPFDLGEYLQSGTTLSPRQAYEEALATYVADHNLDLTLDAVKRSKTILAEAFPFVPGTLRAKILTVAGESTEVPAAFQQSLEIRVQEDGGPLLLSWSTPWPAVYGQRLELAWPGATSADQATLDFFGGVFATQPFEVDLKPVLRLDGVEVATGGAIGSAEDAQLLATLTPPQGAETVALFEMFAGEHAVFAVDFGRVPQQVVDRYAAERDAATDAMEQEAWMLALAGGLYLQGLGSDLEHLSALRWRRMSKLGNVVLTVQRGGVSRSPDGTPLTFSAAPPAIDLGSMTLGLFPPDGQASSQGAEVGTLELLGAQGSFREGLAWSEVGVAEGTSAVSFLTRAVREGQALTRVDAGNVEASLAAAELSAEAEATVRAGAERGLIGWISETQLPVGTWDSTGYVVEDPETGAGGFFVTFERQIEGLGEGLVQFHSPQDLDVVTEPTDVVATIDVEGLESWTLSTRPVGEDGSRVIASGTGAVSDSVLGQFDPTLLLNGMHELVLTGRDAGGQTVSGRITVVVEGGMKIGNFSLAFVDLSVPVSGLDLEVVRTYDSRQAAVQGDFGQGWGLDIRQGSYRNNRPPGDGWQLAGGFLPCDTTLESKSHLTVIRLSEREIYRFALRIVDGAPSVGGGCYGRAEFEYVDGPIPGATLAILGADQVFQETQSSNRVLDVDTLATYVPENVRMTTRDGRVFDLNLGQGVTRVEDPNGNQLEIRPEGIFHSAGKAVDFDRDAEGRITSVTDPAGHERIYAYDAAGDLVVTTNPLGHETQFTYDGDHRIVDIVDPRGVQAVRSEYDADGRLIKVTDALGKPMLFEHDLAANEEIITNRLGVARLVGYDDRGNVIREVDELGKVTTRTFDQKDRRLTETDPLGNTTTRAYDENGYLVSWTDALGNASTLVRDQQGNPTTITDPRGKVTTNTYDGRGNLTSSMDPLGGTTTLTFDARGEVVSMTDALGHETIYGYDAAGNQIIEIDALGTEKASTYDANGNLTSETTTRTLEDRTVETLTTTFEIDALGRVVGTTWPDGWTTSKTYDLLGAVLSTTDELGRETTFSYDGAGRKTGTVYPDGSTETRDYDAEGRLVVATDRSGRETSFAYNAKGRLVRLEHPDGTSRVSTFDDAGRLTAVTDERGNTTTSVYDAAGRRIQVVDALGHATSFTYDAAGNRTAITDPLGNTTSQTYDDADRLLATVLPDGTMVSTEYDEQGNAVARVDQAGIRTEFGYDALGRLEQITDALGGVTRYGYDEQGRRTSQMDANGHVTRFLYDAIGHQVGRSLPGGATESIAYDAVGNPISRTDFNGVTATYTYDANDRLTSRTDSSGTSVAWTYTATGRPATVTDGRGVTTYSYDDRDRLISVAVPEGWVLHYEWDEKGNRTALIMDLGGGTTRTTTYSYDALGRVASLTDSNGGVYSYDYDAAGRRISLGYPNGVHRSWGYDAVGRLASLRTEGSDGSVIQDYTYASGPTGHRQSVTEQDGTVRTWGYDELYRLISERVTGGGGVLIYEDAFAYDSVGNRTERARTAADGSTESTTYGYDERDRLLTAGVIGGGEVAYAWDANGNLTRETSSEGTTLYRWDTGNRLSEVELENGAVVRYTYDASGGRLGRAVSVGGIALEESGWVVDPSGRLANPVGDLDGSGALTAEYLIDPESNETLAHLGASAQYLHGDAIGSPRAVTSSDGTSVGLVEFDAFGNPIGEPTLVGDRGFTGEYLDPDTGLHHLRARWLATGNGRFASADPLGISAAGSQAVGHSYRYALSDPVNWTDPTGLIPRFLLQLWSLGSQVHKEVQEDYEGQYSDEEVFTDRWIHTVVGIPWSQCRDENFNRSCRSRPDIAHYTGVLSGEVYEIKTVGQRQIGLNQLDDYLGLLNLNDHERRWEAGRGYAYGGKQPLEVVVWGDTFHVQVFDSLDGVITYRAEEQEEVYRRSVSAQPDEQVLEALASALLLLYALAGALSGLGA